MRSTCALFLLVFSAYGARAQDAAAGGPLPAWTSAHNLAEVVLALERYHDYGEYDYEIRQVASAAMVYLERRVHDARKDEKLAVVFDIDETALSNWAVMSDCGFCAYKIQVKDYTNTKDPAIEPTLELYRLARKLGVTTWFITGRAESQRDFTSANLHDAGYEGWAGLAMKPDKSTESARTFKPAKRREIEDKGYTIVLNIGDQASDLAGCCAERSFKLPNPFYLVP